MSRKRKVILPKISIIIPSYNKSKYLTYTLQSIIDQKYPNLEVLIQDGGSTDGSVEIIKKFAKSNRKIIKWVSKKDDGQVKAINQGLRKASGEVVTFINADDVYKQDALLRVGRYFQLNPNQLWLTGYGDIINNSSQQTNFLVTKYKNALIAKNHKLLLYMVNYITQPSTFWRRKVHRKIGYLTGTKNYVMEYDFWLKLWGMQKPAIIKNYLASFRLTSDNISATSFNSLLRLDYQIAEDYTNNPAILFLHRIHNLSRVVLLRLLKND